MLAWPSNTCIATDNHGSTGSTTFGWLRMIVGLLMVGLISTASSAAPPTPTCLRIEANGQADTLTVRVGEPVRFHLALPGGESWTQANIGHFIIRTYREQIAIDPKPAPGKDYVEHMFARSGWALVVLSAGPASEKGKSDSWQRTTHCTKVVVRVLPVNDSESEATRRLTPSDDPGLAAKAGERIEIRPMILPPTLEPGADFPVRVYFNGKKPAGLTVTAYRPDGTVDRQKTDAKGYAHFRITQAGRWMVRAVATEEDTETNQDTPYTGDMIFNVPNKDRKTEGAER